MESTKFSPNREERAALEIGQTTITPARARLACAVFLLTIGLVPIAQAAVDFGWCEWRLAHRQEKVRHSAPPEVGDPAAVLAKKARLTGESFIASILHLNAQLLEQIQTLENHLDANSVLQLTFHSPLQQVLTNDCGLGNESVYLGREGWLFYAPDVNFLTGPGFLEPARKGLAAQAPPKVPRQADPRIAIRQFQQQLAERGIRLILLPVPVKPMLVPGRLSGRFEVEAELLQNSSATQFLSEMEQAGVVICDISAELQSRSRNSGPATFLATDTHWTPLGMQITATRLQAMIERLAEPVAKTTRYISRPLEVRHTGDTAALLQLPANSSAYQPQTVQIRQVLESDGSTWQADKKSDVLLLGDSFSNIYSQESLGWGIAAGLAEQLSLLRQRPIDRISQNDNGAYAGRQELSRELARGDDRLAGKRTVIWQFTMRELAFGDWKLLPLEVGQPQQPILETPLELPASVIQGKIRLTSQVPQPKTVPYKDCVMAVLVSRVKSSAGVPDGSDIVVYTWGMRDHQLTAAAHWKIGERVTLRISPWSRHAEGYGRLARVELDDPEFEFLNLPAFWAEVDE